MRRGLPVEVACVWALLAIVGAEVLVTYSRLDPGELYHVSHDGLAGGLSRLVVLANFPFALVAIALLLLLLERLDGARRVIGVIGVALCSAVFWPDVVDPADLDVRPVNAIGASGIAVAAVLCTLVWRREGLDPWTRGVHERLRLGIAVLALVLSIPWLLADIGLYADRLPLLGRIFETGALRTQPGDPSAHPAVHHGHHHGMDGALLVWIALLLLPLVTTCRARWLRLVATGYLALMLCYGAANLANDFWLEQIVKRGWTSWEIPDVLQPSPTVAWGVLVLAAAALWAIVSRRPYRVS